MASLPERVASVEAREKDSQRRIEGMHRTLYGDHGNGGLQADVAAVTTSHRQHVGATDKALDRQTRVLVGDRGDDGLIGDVARLKKEAEARKWLFRVVLSAVVTQAAALLVILVKWIIDNAPRGGS